MSIARLMQMAAARSAAPDIQFVGGYTTSSGGTSSLEINYDGNLSGGLSANVAEGDLVIVTYGASVSASRTFTNSDGFTEVSEFYVNSANGDACGVVYYKVMGATPDTSITITSSANMFPRSTVYVLRNVDTSSPLDVAATTSTGTNSIPTPASITPVTSGSAVFVTALSAGNNSLGSLTNGDLDDYVVTGNTFSAIGSGVYLYDWASGSVSPTQYSVTGGASYFCVTMAIRQN